MAVAPLARAQLAARIAALKSDLLTGNSTFDAVLDVWNNSNAAPLRISYEFAGSAQPGDLDFQSFNGWTAFTSTQKAVVNAALAEFEEIINVDFVGTTVDSPIFDLSIGRVNLGGGSLAGLGGYQFQVSSEGRTVTKSMDSFAVFDSTQSLDFANRNLILHEIGHALTLKHPGHHHAGDEGPFLSAAEDSNKYSVMSYDENPGTGATSLHLMLYDIAALQARFGANMDTRTGNNVYTGPRHSGADVIWDAGGIDTISGAARSAAVTINLRAGAFSSLGASENLAIAYGASIEKAIGGSGNDWLVGNIKANTLTGNLGNDFLTGGFGADLLKGGRGADTLIGGIGRDSLFGGPGADRFDFNLWTSGITATSADRIADWSSADDRINLAFAGSRSNYLELGTSATTVAAAAAAAEAATATKSYVFLFNAASDTGFLFADLNNNDRFETGIILAGAGSGLNFGSFDIV